jgi:hypothetical protein
VNASELPLIENSLNSRKHASRRLLHKNLDFAIKQFSLRQHFDAVV